MIASTTGYAERDESRLPEHWCLAPPPLSCSSPLAEAHSGRDKCQTISRSSFKPEKSGDAYHLRLLNIYPPPSIITCCELAAPLLPGGSLFAWRSLCIEKHISSYPRADGNTYARFTGGLSRLPGRDSRSYIRRRMRMRMVILMSFSSGGNAGSNECWVTIKN